MIWDSMPSEQAKMIKELDVLFCLVTLAPDWVEATT